MGVERKYATLLGLGHALTVVFVSVRRCGLLMRFKEKLKEKKPALTESLAHSSSNVQILVLKSGRQTLWKFVILKFAKDRILYTTLLLFPSIPAAVSAESPLLKFERRKSPARNSSSGSKMFIPPTRNIGLPMMNLMRFKGLPILQQLHIEEQLLRTSSENWCIINDGTNDPTIVMGVSGKPAELLEIESVLRDQFGGNAQSITKNKWIHHTSFLWDFDVRNMAYLKLPKRAPAYRSARGHLDFICRLKDYMPRSTFIDKTVEAAGTQFSLRSFEPEATESCSETDFHSSTRFLTNEELEAAAVAGQ
ncbi:MYB110 protein [Hibiscus syriacus]|uniref:MYB110 protein n=1 Tax=Hibiscus syriacus TaxID=106335 RepID=A0A6A2ZMR5_HIBSY|nr:MYB110 protein [Hibiscus syriacus]